MSRRASASSPGGSASAPDCDDLREQRADRRRAAAGSPISPSASAALACTSGDGSVERRDERIARAPVADQSQRERGHLPHFRIAVAQQRQQRLDAFGQPDATDGQRRAAPHARFLVAEQRARDPA